MATSGSVDYSASRDEIITEAMELIGALAAGDSPTANDLTSCSRTLNMMVKGLMAEGVQLWKVAEGSITLTASTASYAMGTSQTVNIDKPLRIIEMRRRETSSSIDTPLSPMSRDEYMRLSNKSLATIPTQYYFQPDITTSTVYIWPVASTDTASDYTLKFSYYSLIEDFDAAANTPDFPVEWMEALSNMLAVRIAPKYGAQIPPSVAALSEMGKEMLLSWGQEDASVYFGVDFGQG